MRPGSALLDLHGLRVLVVEDDFLIALSVGEALEHAGAEIVLAGGLDEALALVDAPGTPFDAAVLDLDLNGDRSYPLADALRRQNTSFVFTTGYGVESIDEPYRDVPRCEKPVDFDVLVALIAAHAIRRPPEGQAANRCSSSTAHINPVPAPGSTGSA